MNCQIKKGCALLLVMLLSVAGCGKKKKCVEPCLPMTDKEATVSLPTGQSKELQSVFDDDIAEFALVDETDNKASQNTPKTGQDVQEEDPANEFSWIDEDDQQKQDLKTVYFDFDKYAIKKDQETVVDHDVKKVKDLMASAEKDGKRVNVVIEGHSCHSAGSASYNLALSEKRAKVLKDRMVQAGVSSTSIKVVGRGQECPALSKDGKPVSGTREQQWLNRRDEINVLNA